MTDVGIGSYVITDVNRISSDRNERLQDQEEEHSRSFSCVGDRRRPSSDEKIEKNQLSITLYQDDDHVYQDRISKIVSNDEWVSNCYMIDCEIDEEDAIHAIDVFQNDDALLEDLGARTEYPVRHEKRVQMHYPDIQACFKESRNDKIEGLRELPFPLPSKTEVTWLNEEISEVNIGSQEIPRMLKMGKLIEAPLQNELIQSFHEYSELFAWSYKDMLGLDENFVVHNLVVEKGAMPIKQKARKMPFQISLLVKREIEKLLEAGFIRSIDYSEWMANLVPVKKPTGEIRVCTDFRDLNKACPKDDFPLPNIDMIIDSLAGYEMLSFMDGFSGYNQIRIKESDQHKTAFRTPWGNFCYKVMPFGLKNAGATYQRAMTAMFHDFIHKIVEVYVDDILIKYKRKEDHVQDLKAAFERMKQYKLRVKPQKCVFGVSSRKLLGHIVSRRGVEVDPKKIKAILEMAPPTNLKQLRSLQGKMQAIRRFICQLTDKIAPMSHLLKKDVEFKWDNKCQESFDKIKEYLLHPTGLGFKEFI